MNILHEDIALNVRQIRLLMVEKGVQCASADK